MTNKKQGDNTKDTCLSTALSRLEGNAFKWSAANFGAIRCLFKDTTRCCLRNKVVPMLIMIPGVETPLHVQFVRKHNLDSTFVMKTVTV